MAQYNGGKAGKTTTLVQGAGNDWGTSMWGFYGKSQLTPDLDGFYKIETGFNAMNGTFNSGTNSLFNRRAYVGLDSKQLGKIYAGKDLFIDNDIWDIDPMLQENMSTATLVNGRNWQGASDMVEYRSPDMHGLNIAAQGTFNNGDSANGYGSQALTTRVSNAWGVSVRYDIKPVHLYAIYDEMGDKNGHDTSLYSASKEGILGFYADFKPVRIYGGWEELYAGDGSQAKGGTPLVYGSSSYSTYYPGAYATRAQMEWLGAQFEVNSKLVLRAAGFHTNINDQAGHATLVTGGFEYYLSKNFFLYTTVGEVLNGGKAAFSADIGAPPPAPGKDQFAGYSGFSISF
jgi:predicted porin